MWSKRRTRVTILARKTNLELFCKIPKPETMQAKGYGFDALRFTLYSVFRVRSKRYRRGEPVDIDTRAGDKPVIDRVGVDGGEGTPVPIPNTAVKLTCADNTWLEAAREDKTTPTQSKALNR